MMGGTGRDAIAPPDPLHRVAGAEPGHCGRFDCGAGGRGRARRPGCRLRLPNLRRRGREHRVHVGSMEPAQADVRRSGGGGGGGVHRHLFRRDEAEVDGRGAAYSDEIVLMRATGSRAIVLLHVVVCIEAAGAAGSSRSAVILSNRRHLGVITFLTRRWRWDTTTASAW